VLGSVAEGAAASRPHEVLFDWLDRLPVLAVGTGLVVLALVAYWLPGTDRYYNHFVWQALAFLDGRGYVTPEDVLALAADVLRHRIVPTYRADAEGTTTDAILAQIFAAVPVP
jgi:hypothetical protein